MLYVISNTYVNVNDYIYIYTYIYIHIYIYIYIYTYIYIHKYTYNVYTCYTYVHIHIYVYTYIYTPKHIYILTHTHMNVYVYVKINTLTYIHILNSAGTRSHQTEQLSWSYWGKAWTYRLCVTYFWYLANYLFWRFSLYGRTFANFFPRKCSQCQQNLFFFLDNEICVLFPPLSVLMLQIEFNDRKNYGCTICVENCRTYLLCMWMQIHTTHTHTHTYIYILTYIYIYVYV